MLSKIKIIRSDQRKIGQSHDAKIFFTMIFLRLFYKNII